MEFRKMVMTNLYAKQPKRHRCKEQTVGLCGRRQGWDDLREQHWNMYIAICETDRQSRFDAWGRVLRAGSLGWPWGMGGEGGGRGVQDGGHMYTRGWFMSMYGKTTTILQSNYPPIKINYIFNEMIGKQRLAGIQENKTTWTQKRTIKKSQITGTDSQRFQIVELLDLVYFLKKKGKKLWWRV